MTSTMGRRRQSNHNLPPHMHEKSGTYYYVTSDKPRKWINLGKDLDAARLKWAAIENGPSDSGKLPTLIDEWLLSDKFRALAESTQTCYVSISRQLKEVFADIQVADVRPHHVASWLDNHYSKHQANLGKAVLSNVFDVAIWRGIIDRNPAREIQRLAVGRRNRYLEDDEFKAIRNQAHPILKAAMDISYVTGARISDILAIPLRNWGPDGLTIKRIKTGKLQLFKRNPTLELVIDNAKKIPRPVRGLYLLCTRKGQPYSYATINDWWQEAVEKSGVKDAHFHDIRGKAATDAKRDGVDYLALLGHTSKAMSERYIKIEEAQQVETLQKVL